MAVRHARAAVPGPAHAVLRPEAGIIDLIERPETERLARWCLAPDGPLVRLVEGQGGQGKSHLAQRVCERVRQQPGWAAGFVDLAPSAEASHGGADVAHRTVPAIERITGAMESLVGFGRSALLVVDYAEQYAALLPQLIRTAAQLATPAGGDGQNIRILLLARHTAGWWDEIAVTSPLHPWIDPDPVLLNAVSEQPGVTGDAVWAGAIAAFAHYAVASGFLRDLPALESLTSRPPGRYATTLDLFAEALIRVLAVKYGTGGDPGEEDPRRDPVAELVRHERRYLATAWLSAEVRVAATAERRQAEQAHALAAVIMHPAASREQARRRLAASTVLKALGDDHLDRLAGLLGRIYPSAEGAQWEQPRPDRLADTHLLMIAEYDSADADAHRALLDLCDPAESAAHADHIVRVLTRALSTPRADELHAKGWRRIRSVVEALVRDHPPGFLPAVVRVDPVRFRSAVVEVLERPDADVAGPPTLDVSDLGALVHELATRFPESTSRNPIGLAAVTHHIAQLKAIATDSVITPLALDQQYRSILLYEVGDFGEATLAAAQAMVAAQELAANSPARFSAFHGQTLTQVGRSLARAGRPDAAGEYMQQAEEAFRIAAEAAEGTDDDGETAAGRAVNQVNLSILHTALGQAAYALAGNEANVARLRILSERDPALLPNLTSALRSLGSCYADLGHHREAHRCVEEAAHLARTLVDSDRDRFLPLFADTANSLALRLQALSQSAAALTWSEQAVDALRSLVETSESGYRADLAVGLTTLGLTRHDVGHTYGALAATMESIELLRPLTVENPAAYEHHLAKALNNLASMLLQAAQHDQALEVAAEALTMRRRLVERSRARYLPDLFDSLHINVGALAENGRLAQAIVLAEEAVAVVRPLAAARPARHEPDLVTALASQAEVLGRLGRRAEAVSAFDEAIPILERLAQQWPDSRFPTRLAVARARRTEMLAGDEGSTSLPAGILPEGAMAEIGLNVLRKLSAQSQAGSNRDSAARTSRVFGDRLAEAGRFAEAAEAYSDAITAYEECEEWEEAALLLSRLGNVLTSLDRHADAAVTQLRSADLYQQVGDDENEALSSLLAAIAHTVAGQSQQSVDAARRALGAARRFGELDLLAKTLTIYGGTLEEAHLDTEAAAVFEKAAEVYQRLGQADEQGAALCRLADCLRMLGRYRKAVEVARQGISLLRGSDLVEDLGFAYHCLANCLSRLRKRGEAVRAYAAAADCFVQAGNAEARTDVLEDARAVMHRLRLVSDGDNLERVAAVLERNR
ncbi:tetratricopeptide repeat protein [Catenulispora yoronensis]